jgi:hypothetical protein
MSFVLHSVSDATVFCHVPVRLACSKAFDLKYLKRKAILLSLGEDPFSITQVDVDRYKVALVYTDKDGDKVMITSGIASENALFVAAQFYYSSKGSVKVFASVEEKKDEQKAPTHESDAESLTQTVHSPTSIVTVATYEMVTYIVKLALVGSGGKKGEQFRTNLKV